MAEQEALDANRAVVDDSTIDQWLPHAVLTDAAGTQLSSRPLLACDAVSRPAQPSGLRTLAVLTLPVEESDAGALATTDARAVVADGDLVYASADRFYVATSTFGAWSPEGRAPAADAVRTAIHAFDTTGTTATPLPRLGQRRRLRLRPLGLLRGRRAAAGGHHDRPAVERPGHGRRVAVVDGGAAEDGDRLVETGRLDGLGKGERIFAVRYFGDLATVVTFRQTDPLYTVDLSDPAAPRLAGELKVPGFSSYLHPVGDGRLLGVGQDADAEGRTTSLQLSLFDVSDPASPGSGPARCCSARATPRRRTSRGPSPSTSGAVSRCCRRRPTPTRRAPRRSWRSGWTGRDLVEAGRWTVPVNDYVPAGRPQRRPGLRPRQHQPDRAGPRRRPGGGRAR